MTSEKDNSVQIKRLANDIEYFNNVFKRTEKIISVIFYILSHTNASNVSDTHVNLIKDKALKTHEVSLETLKLQLHEASLGLQSFLHALVALESVLRIAESAGVIPPKINQMIYEQLFSVERFLSNHYLKDQGITFEEGLALPESKNSRVNSRGRLAEGSGAQIRRRNVHIPAGDISSEGYLVHSKLTDRAQRIQTVLEAKPQATIKDISGIITDISEKTIQRELNSLIEKGQVMREGERRWSRYSVSR